VDDWTTQNPRPRARLRLCTDPRRGRLDAAHLVGRIIRDPPIDSLKPLTPGHVRVPQLRVFSRSLVGLTVSVSRLKHSTNFK